MSPFRALYALALALLVSAFVGFGIAAFYQEPEPPEYPQELEFVGENPTERQRELMAEQRREEEAYQQRISGYNQVVSVVAIGAAVVLLAASLLWLRRFPVIGDGTTLGAVLTLFYGLIRAFMTDSEQFRFVAIAVGLVILLVLVYRQFSRPHPPDSNSPAPA